MSDWMPFNDGLPNVIVKELEIHYDEGTISAATFGRGVWKSDLNTLSTVNSNYFNDVKFTIYPNPANDKITIHTTENKVLISIYSITGQKVISTKSKSVNTANLAKGYYVVEVKSKFGTKREKLVIK